MGMRGRLAIYVCLGALGACIAMTAIPKPTTARCRVLNVGKLGASLDSSSICEEIQNAVASQTPSVPYTVEIRVLSASKLSATLIVDGRTLPVQNFAVMDRELTSWSIKNFAGHLAILVSQAAER